MHPENGLHMANEAKNMTMVWDSLSFKLTIRSDNTYDQLHYKKITQNDVKCWIQKYCVPCNAEFGFQLSTCLRTVESHGKPSSMWSVGHGIFRVRSDL